jgi:hypothetical protein
MTTSKTTPPHGHCEERERRGNLSRENQMILRELPPILDNIDIIYLIFY